MTRQEEYQPPSRQQRVMEAKEAFGGSNSYSQSQTNFSTDSRYRESFADLEDGDEIHKRHTFRLLRIMAAGMLFFVLVVAFSTGFSYHGFNQAYVQEKLNDETTWNRMEKQVQKVYLSLEKQWKERVEVKQK